MKNQFQGISHLMAKAFVESVHPGTWLGEGREKLAPSELEALVPGDWLPLVPTEKSIGQFWNFLGDFWKRLTRNSLLPRVSQRESRRPQGCPNQCLCDFSPDLEFLRELYCPSSPQLTPHMRHSERADSLLSHQLKPSQAVGILWILFYY